MSEIGGANLEDQVKKAEEVHKLKTHHKVSSPEVARRAERVFAQAPEPEHIPIQPQPVVQERQESKPSGQFLSEIPQGLNCQEVGMWVENRLRRAEATDEFKQPESIGSLSRYINGYQFAGSSPESLPQDEIERKSLVQLVEIRGYMQHGLLNLRVRNYEGFASVLPMITGERLGVLKEKLPGLMEAINVLEGKDNGVENSQGIYFRLRKSIPAEKDRRDQIEKTAKEAIKRARDVQLRERKVATSNDQDIETTMKVVSTLMDVSWMSSYYAGPVEKDTSGNEVLRDERIFNGLNQPLANKDGDLKRYFENRELWETRRQDRIKNGVGGYIKEPKDGSPNENLGDPAANARRLLNFPEDMQHSNPPLGNIESLRYSAEIYMLSLPHFFGYDSLTEFMEKSSIAGKRNDTFKWANLMKGAGSAAAALMELVNEPLKGGEAVGDPKNFGNTIKNIEEVIGKYQSYLDPGYKNLFSYANSRIIESVFKFANGDSEDRKRFFPRWPKFGTWFLNSAVEAFSSKFSPEDRDELKKNLKASDSTLIRKELSSQGTSWLFKILQAFGAQVMKNK